MYNVPEGVEIFEIAVDYQDKNVYWIEQNEDKVKQIRLMSLYDGGIKTFNVKNIPNKDYDPVHLAVDEKYVYFVTQLPTMGQHRHLQRAGKHSGEYDYDFDVTEDSFDGGRLMFNQDFSSIFVTNGQSRYSQNHPCTRMIEDCDGFCVAVPGEVPGRYHGELVKRCIKTDRNRHPGIL